MAEIRSPAAGLPAPQGSVARPSNPARTAAQRAFFEAALGAGQAAASSAPQPAAPPAARSAPVLKVDAAATADAPPRHLRPGSLLDIKV